MSDEQALSPSPKPRRFRVPVERLRRTTYGGVIGPAEILALGGAALVLILVVISYLYFLVPARSNLETAKQERERLRKLLDSSRQVVQEELTTEEKVVKITQSLDSFENQKLLGRVQGRMDLYEKLNELMLKNGLRNTSGPSYTTLEPIGSKPASSRSAAAKWQSVYPGIAINVTVEGQYANLRRFVRDIEASNMFVIINGVELERAERDNAPSAAEGEGGTTKPSLVSLRLDMSTYFQRTTSEPAAEPAKN